jgi:hypothetical protein
MLIVSNTADPITPIASGLLINRHMANSSRIVIQNGPGHCSPALVSLCTLKVQREYWAGNPPKNGDCYVTLLGTMLMLFQGHGVRLTKRCSRMIKIRWRPCRRRTVSSYTALEIWVASWNKYGAANSGEYEVDKPSDSVLERLHSMLVIYRIVEQ